MLYIYFADRFYEYTILLTVISLLITTFLHALTLRTCRWSVGHNMALAARSLNLRILAACTDAQQFDVCTIIITMTILLVVFAEKQKRTQQQRATYTRHGYNNIAL